MLSWPATQSVILCGADAVCDAKAQEVVRVDPGTVVNSTLYQRQSVPALGQFWAVRETFTAAVNACRLNRHRLGGCTGFALEVPNREPAAKAMPEAEKPSLSSNDTSGEVPTDPSVPARYRGTGYGSKVILLFNATRATMPLRGLQVHRPGGGATLQVFSILGCLGEP